ncbi:hypothetical protein PF005_g18475 [Phytophthora fragariae]|uniref:Uncharacterized protein n=1 Tax=Phytophthora fragariae TaxID=53985 RepID=A0A6A3ZU47_9STRA|nr:hypothetical protein PF003_g2287 [Phytophthora fragariae]KAE8942172.1 hypothetical protein PF009_g8061 [Phytophthora fragariae]KAE8992655.1 hypothetical protein PF011_g17471 [Phytophthora fragariae]KAE9092734.1 hypothetical protein PF010_g17738 [Phytophthora fragariae]KAE9099622.1 hypothetical protein PF007_g15807 [Phytophthora fragariae]
MKRRTAFKTNEIKNEKKITKKKVVKSPASSILGLKKDKVDAISEDRTRWSSEEGDECQRLRQQLERVLVDHQRQEEEIVALRALAKSLKEEVEAIQERQQLQDSSDKVKGWQRGGSHEFFKLDVQIEKLEGVNAELCRQLEDSQEELQRARAYIADKLPVYKLAAVKANAEIRCVKSQLQHEREHSDRLQEQLVKCKTKQDDVLVRALPERGNNQNEHDDDDDFQESEAVRRERETFFRQCMYLQDGCIPDNKYASSTQSELDVELAGFESTARPNSEMETGKLIHEDLLGLNLYY